MCFGSSVIFTNRLKLETLSFGENFLKLNVSFLKVSCRFSLKVRVEFQRQRWVSVNTLRRQRVRNATNQLNSAWLSWTFSWMQMNSTVRWTGFFHPTWMVSCTLWAKMATERLKDLFATVLCKNLIIRVPSAERQCVTLSWINEWTIYLHI